MTEPAGSPGPSAAPPTTPPPTPGERRLDRPPSDRYRPPETEEPTTAGSAAGGSLVRGAVLGDLAALLGAAATVVLGGVLTVSAGLLVVAAASGWVIGQAVKIGCGADVAGTTRSVVAIASAVLSIVVGQVGLWLFAGAEGGVLPLLDFLGQTYGVLVPLQAVIATSAAWWSAR